LLCRVDPITEMIHNNKLAAPSRFSKPRKRAPMDKPAFPKVEAFVRNLKAARVKPGSMEKVEEISGIALALYGAGSVTHSYNAFAEAVRAAHSLPAHLHQDALSLVRAEFRKTDMDIACYDGLLCPYGSFRHIQAH